MLNLKIITPEREVFSDKVEKVSCQTVDGEITILPRHTPLLTLLTEGVITITTKNGQEYFSAGSGYVETDGKNVQILISRALGQEEIDEKTVLEVKNQAEKLLKEQKDKRDRQKAFAMLRRATLDLKVLKKRRRAQ